jgi:hypothetical protein
MKEYFRNPFSEYLRFVVNKVMNRRRFENFDQAYMALVKKSSCQPNVRIGRECLIEESKIGAYTYVSDKTKNPSYRDWKVLFHRAGLPNWAGHTSNQPHLDKSRLLFHHGTGRCYV